MLLVPEMKPENAKALGAQAQAEYQHRATMQTTNEKSYIGD